MSSTGVRRVIELFSYGPGLAAKNPNTAAGVTCTGTRHIRRLRCGAETLVFRVVAGRRLVVFMSAAVVVGLIEEMINLKVQQSAEANLKVTPDIIRLLNEKRETDRRRLEQIRTQLITILEGADQG